MDLEHIDMLVDILRHLHPRGLAASRCVCKAWRAIVDHHRLLRADLLPLSLDAVIYNIDKMEAPKLFARRSTTRYITSRLDYIDDRPGYGEVVGEMTDYCNGLILVFDDGVRAVVNPATRQWASLPLLSCACSARTVVTSCGRCSNNRYIVYDPSVSPHYEVMYIPRVPLHLLPTDAACNAEWPPSPYSMHVFSSNTNSWTERSFIRQGDAAGTTIADVKSHPKSDGFLYYSALWQGSLYVPSRHGFLLRISLCNDKYQVIKLPKQGKGSLERIGKSKKGVYCVLDVDGRSTFQIWFLFESCGVVDWVLNNEINFDTAWRIYPYQSMSLLDHKELLLRNDANHQVSDEHIENGPWISQSDDQKELLLKNDVSNKVVHEYGEALSKDDFEWDSDEENATTTVHWPKERNPEDCPPHRFYCLGFHPYKEIALFHDDHRSATFAYYFKISKVRYLGIMEHKYSDVDISFAYTPCWKMELPGSNN